MLTNSFRMRLTLLLALALTTTRLFAADPAPPAEKLFAVQFTLGPGWDATKPFPEQKHIAEHSANLNRLWNEGVIVYGGRHGEVGLVVMRGADEAAIRAELAKDPSLAAGTFKAAVEEYRPFFRGAARSVASSPEIAVVRASVAAFNAHDIDALTAHYAEDIKWLSVDSEKQSIEADNRAAIREWLVGYFKSVPDVRSEISDVTQTGPHVSFRERASWTAKDGSRRAQSAIAVYEVREGKIKRAWYFPAAREGGAPPAKAAPAAK